MKTNSGITLVPQTLAIVRYDKHSATLEADPDASILFLLFVIIISGIRSLRHM